MTSQPHPFKYDALPSPSSIRLVTILAPDNDDADMDKRPAISCRLETGDLSDAPAYDALSYAWGSPFWRGDGGEELNEYSVDNYCPITVNGCERWITKNLFEGLLRLRHHLFDAKEKEAFEGDGGLWFQCEVVGDVDQRLQPLDKTPLIQAAEIGSDCELKNIKNRTPLECCEQRHRGDSEQVSAFLKAPTAKDADCGPWEAKFCPLRVWVDALCINQHDAVEKVAQVEMMKRIYASAQSTIVWLGVEDQGTKSALQALDILLNYPQIVGLIGPERTSSRDTTSSSVLRGPVLGHDQTTISTSRQSDQKNMVSESLGHSGSPSCQEHHYAVWKVRAALGSNFPACPESASAHRFS
ncbi:uncharacterized protein IWZ02DRAFT_509564 [Phyllosticta citriasiana]|uniref:uncharacterized protein n=1 Tax=Phyllosticta citriasiana TaxID=595635 RepID=UPI0030FDABB2